MSALPAHDDRLYHVRLIDVPVEGFLRLQQQHDAMLREFSLIALGADDAGGVPRRILAVSAEVRQRFSFQSATFRQGVQQALERGAPVVTLELHVSLDTLRMVEDLLVLFEEGDLFCRQGQLLTPPSPPEVIQLRRWLVGEVIRQVRDGSPPTPYEAA